jgi:hypothetical protein
VVFKGRVLRILTAVCAGLLLAAASAHAEARIARATIWGIQFGGESVVYQDQTSQIDDADTVDYEDRIVRRVPGHAPRVVAEPSSTLESNFEDGEDDLRWDASAAALLTGVGYTNYFAADVTGGHRIEGGPFGRRPFRFASCNGDPITAPPSVAVWDELGAYTNGCPSDRTPLVVRRLDRPHEKPLFRLKDVYGAIDLAGDYVAIAYGGDPHGALTVYNWRDGKVVYETSAPFYSEEDGAATLELQPDGKVAALLDSSGYYCKAAWLSPAEPTAHVVGTTDCGASIRLRSDRLAWMRVAKRGHRELVVTPLGAPGRTEARFPGTLGDSFAWDGGRLAYSVRRCDGRSDLLLRRQTGGPVFRDRAPIRCPLRVTRKRLRVTRGSEQLRVPMRCPRGCSGTMQILGSYDSIEEPFGLRRGRHFARLYLDRDTRGRLDEHGHTRIHVRIEVDRRSVASVRHDVQLRLYTP